MRRSARLALVGLMATLGTANLKAQASAATCPAPPESAKGAGDQAMLGNRHAEALACYEAAYRYAPSPALLYNQARALEFSKQNAEALRRLLLFQRSASVETRQRVPQLQQLIDSLTAQVAELRVECSVSGASVSVNQEPVGQTPLPEPLWVDPGEVQLRVAAANYESFDETLPIRAGERRVLHIALDPAPPSPPAPLAATPLTTASTAPAPAPAATPGATLGELDSGASPVVADDSSSPLRVAGWTALGVGAAGIILAGVSYGVAASHRSQICGGASECSSDDYDAAALDAYDSWRAVYTVSWIMAGAGLASGGALLYVSATKPQEAAWALRVTPGSVFVSGRF